MCAQPVMLKTTPVGDPLAVMTAGGTEVSVEVDPSPQAIVIEPVPVVKSLAVAPGLVSVTVATSAPVNGIPSTAWIVAPCEASGASATAATAPAHSPATPPPLSCTVKLIELGEPPVVSSAYVCVPVTMNVPLASCEIVPAELVVSPQLIVAEKSLTGAIRFGIGERPHRRRECLPLDRVNCGWRDRSDNRRRVCDRECGDRGR